ncbi:hypothetical protein BH10BAC3_BH10BAC3_09240 [soil metagenome]
MSWTVMIIITIALVALMIFVIRRNQTDEKKIESQLNNTDSVSKEESSHTHDENELKV